MLLTDGKASSTLLDQIARTSRYRSNGLWPDTRNVIIFADGQKIVEACQAVAAHCPEVTIRGVCVHKGDTQYVSAVIHGTTVSLPVLSPEELKDYPECLAVLYWSGHIVPDLLYHLETAIRHTLSIAIFPRIPFGTGRKCEPELYRRHQAGLEQIYASLADDESRLSFASVIKGLTTGEIDWLRPPICPEYQHPAVSAVSGDIVLDAGLFDSTVLRRFAMTVGSTGHVYGFEPEPRNFSFVEETLHRFGDPGNITLIRKGVFSHRRFMHISDEGASGTLIAEASRNTSPCEVVDIDSFAEEYSLPRIDLIKMDIEGAEMDAIRGDEYSIRRWKPKLQICAYHHIQDIIEIPDIIKDINPKHQIYFTAHTPYLNEYVYYCK